MLRAMIPSARLAAALALLADPLAEVREIAAEALLPIKERP
jgi:hypothetical protein